MIARLMVVFLSLACMQAGAEIAWRDSSWDAAAWPTVNNYHDGVRIEFGVPVEGAARALRVTGLLGKDAKDRDTAWSIRSRRVALPRRAPKYELALFIRSEKTSRRTKGGEDLSTAILWYDAAGRFVGRKGVMAGLRKGGFNRVQLVDRLPAKAAAFEVQLGLDFPDLEKGETVCFSEVSFSLLGEDAVCGVRGPDVAPPAVRLLTPSPTRDVRAPVRLHFRDESEIVWDGVKVTIDGTNRTANCVRKGTELVFQPAEPWSEGLHAVKVAVADVHGNACEHEKKFLVGDVPEGASKVTIRDDGVTLVDGVPFFPVGIYNVRRHPANGNDLDRAVRELREAGFNLTHSYRFADDPDLWKAAEKYGMKLWYNATGVDDAFVGSRRRRAQVLAWYIGDDTSTWVTPEQLRDRDENVRAVDPARPTTQADAVHSELATDNYQEYASATDVYMPEIYPVYGRPADTACVAQVVRDMERIREDNAAFGGGRNHATWPIIQNFMGWTAWKRYPTPEETTAMSFAALIHGAKGILWYTYAPTLEPNPAKGRYDAGVLNDPAAWNTATNLSRRIASLAPVLLARGDEPIAVEVLSGPTRDAYGQPSVTALLKRHEGKAYLLAVNATTQTVRARLPVLPEENAEVLWESRVVRPAAGGLEDDFAPFGVHVYSWKMK